MNKQAVKRNCKILLPKTTKWHMGFRARIKCRVYSGKTRNQNGQHYFACSCQHLHMTSWVLATHHTLASANFQCQRVNSYSISWRQLHGHHPTCINEQLHHYIILWQKTDHQKCHLHLVQHLLEINMNVYGGLIISPSNTIHKPAKLLPWNLNLFTGKLKESISNVIYDQPWNK